MSQLGTQGSGRARLWRGLSQALCSAARWLASLCPSWRGSRSVLLSLPARRSPFPLTSPFLSLCLSPALSRGRSTWRSRFGCGRRSGSRSLGRVRDSRVPKGSSMARFLPPPGNGPWATTNHKFPRQVPRRGGSSPGRTRTRPRAVPKGRTCPWPLGGNRGDQQRRWGEEILVQIAVSLRC